MLRRTTSREQRLEGNPGGLRRPVDEACSSSKQLPVAPSRRRGRAGAQVAGAGNSIVNALMGRSRPRSTAIESGRISRAGEKTFDSRASGGGPGARMGSINPFAYFAWVKGGGSRRERVLASRQLKSGCFDVDADVRDRERAGGVWPKGAWTAVSSTSGAPGAFRVVGQAQDVDFPPCSGPTNLGEGSRAGGSTPGGSSAGRQDR